MRLNKVLRVLSFIFLLGLFFPVWSAGENSGKLIDYLAQEKINLTYAMSQAKKISPPNDRAEYIKNKQQNDALMALNRAKIANFEGFLNNQKKMQSDFNNRLKQLQQVSSDSQLLHDQEKIAKINSLNEINSKTIDLIDENLNLAKNFQDSLLANAHVLELWDAKETLLEELGRLHAQEERLDDSLRKLFDNSLKLQQEIKTSTQFDSLYMLEARLLLNSQVINLTQQKITELNLQRGLARADYSLLKTPDIRTLQKVTDIYKDSISQLSEMEQALKKMIAVLKQEQPHLRDRALKQQFDSLLRIINVRITDLSIQEQTLQEDLETHEQALKKQLSIRLSLSEYKITSWPIIINQLLHIPAQFYIYVKSLYLKIKDNYIWQDTWPSVFMWLAMAFTFLILIGLKRGLVYLTQDKERSRLSSHLYNGLLTVVSRNSWLLIILSLGFELFYFNKIPIASYLLLIHLALVWVSFRSLIMVARLGLMERVSDASGKDVHLFYRIKWLLIMGGWITGLMVLSYELPLSLLLQDIFNRLFMLFLLTASFVLWRSKEAIAHLLHPMLVHKKKYFRNAVMLLVILAPLMLLITAVIGLVGYINLAWTLSRYQLKILVIISTYILLRGLLFDLLELFSEWMISQLTNGWLWIEVILKPIDKILRLALFIFCFLLLFKLFGWDAQSQAAVSLRQIVNYPLVNVSGIHITLKSIVEFLILLSIFMWVAKWTREFCFRWVFRNTSDPGIRNSLSVFSQYTIVLIGGFITLRVLGLDFSGMSMILGGFAVGMGFGLRDFASNIVGGLMLLIERPVREGDLITIGSYEGRVAHIGIRSMRVSSWDNMEVLIPNAETFNKPFTNWTHQDSIIRTVISIKVNRDDDPLLIQQLILDVLAIIPEIVDEPPTQVLLKEINEALIEFEVRYFINIELTSRVEVRSKVLLAITAQFKAAGIKPPIPPFRVEFNAEEDEVVDAKKSPPE